MNDDELSKADVLARALEADRPFKADPYVWKHPSDPQYWVGIDGAQGYVAHVNGWDDDARELAEVVTQTLTMFPELLAEVVRLKKVVAELSAQR